ncbi:FxLYD domain-containing protein [Aquibacillus rhizosphaerae]|uniref:FxLYD domain-containing protein n=1 Tax=Aquibacillus rhizosphaerae TaxID=3051431 RepID=A0ABT7L8H9_9BACI|nr:FxLYD domain-containing protein [Aquibacillus sp. LR5S19]MDL4842169.1 FxLYD domain-containing protein [Aquibacillus sp. LR5S19]
MLYCPYCGGRIKDNELFCTQCGEKLPEDMYERNPEKNKTNYRFWYIPITILIVVLISIGSYYLHLEKRETLAKKAFANGEELAFDGQYFKALNAFEKALEHKSNFPSAEVTKDFMQTALQINSKLTQANSYLEEENYQEALTLMTEAENKIKNYNGEIVSLLVDDIVAQRKTIQLKQLRAKLENNPSIEELKTLIWEAEEIQHEEATKIVSSLREKIVAHTFSKANEQLKDNQFSDAREIVEDGLQYAPESEQLQSLKTTIQKEKTAFETALEQRIEQAMNTAEEEREMNKNDAVELIDINVSNEEPENLVVSGKIKSVATVPINSVSVEYILLDADDTEILSNEVYVYPDTLYPDEEGKFDFTHYDLNTKEKNIKVKIEKIKWFLD